jgi:hypothetical protein
MSYRTQAEQSEPDPKEKRWSMTYDEAKNIIKDPIMEEITRFVSLIFVAFIGFVFTIWVVRDDILYRYLLTWFYALTAAAVPGLWAHRRLKTARGIVAAEKAKRT